MVFVIAFAARPRGGKIRYWGMSNALAWYVAKLTTLALVRGMPEPIALQYCYTLVSREVESEHMPLALDSGCGLRADGRQPRLSGPSNVAPTNLCLPAERIAKLDAASAPDDAMIYGLFTAAGRQHTVFRGSAVAFCK